MNILITRPLIDSEDLMGKLFSMGHKILHIPTLKIISKPSSLYDSKILMHLFSPALMVRI